MIQHQPSARQSDQSLNIHLSDLNPCSPEFDWTNVPEYELAHRLWTDRYGGYEGKACLRAAASPELLALLFIVDEPEDCWPPRVYAQNDGEPVYEDSAVEFFFQPQRAVSEYMNIEMNSAGVMLTAIGPNRDARTSLESELKDTLTLQSFSADRGDFPRGINSAVRRWAILLGIPADLLDYFGYASGSQFSPDLTLKANAYKCGDKTPKPHYRSLFRVTSADPDYHRPQDFGTIKFL